MRKKGFVLWLTGHSGAGKTTLARSLERSLQERSLDAEVLDGDEVRRELSPELSFSKEDRDRNIMRIGYVARLLARHGVCVIVAAISPYRETRAAVRERCMNFIEVFVDCPLDVCEKRDVKGLYRKEREGGIPNFTGKTDPYEPPLDPEITLRTDREDLEESEGKVLAALERSGFIPVKDGAG